MDVTTLALCAYVMGKPRSGSVHLGDYRHPASVFLGASPTLCALNSVARKGEGSVFKIHSLEQPQHEAGRRVY